MATRLDIINAALARIGEQALEFDGQEAEAAFTLSGTIDPLDDVQRITSAIYPSIRHELLNAHPWSWLTQRHVPSLVPAQAGESSGDWPAQHRYALSNPYVASVRAVYRTTLPQQPQPSGWTVQGGFLYSSFPVGWVEDQRQIPEPDFPQLFVTALEVRLASEYALPLMQDIDTMRVYERKAEAALNNAMRVDAQSHPVARIPRFDWEEARAGIQGSLTQRFGIGI